MILLPFTRWGINNVFSSGGGVWDGSVDNEAEMYSLNVPEGQSVLRNDNGGYYLLTTPSPYYSAAQVIGNGYYLDGIYTERGIHLGRKYFTKLGVADSTTHNCIVSNGSGDWFIMSNLGAAAETATGGEFPWEAGFVTVSVYPVTQGDLNAGVLVTGAGTATANTVYLSQFLSAPGIPILCYRHLADTSAIGPNSIVPVDIGMFAIKELVSGDAYYINTSTVFPWDVSSIDVASGAEPAPTVTRSNIASRSNWMPAIAGSVSGDSYTTYDLPTNLGFVPGPSGTIEFSFTRPPGADPALIFSFGADSIEGGGEVGPSIYDSGSYITVTQDDDSYAAVLTTEFPRTGNRHVVVIAWGVGTDPTKHTVWYNGVLQTIDSDLGGVLASNQTFLVWGASDMTNASLRYWPFRLTSPPPEEIVPLVGPLVVADEPARLNLNGLYVGQQVYQTDNETIYQLNAPLETLTAVFISGAGEPSANGIYTQRGTYDGKPYYNLLGQPDSTSNAVIIWYGGGWFLSVGPYTSLDDVAYPWEISTWVNPNAPTGDPTPTATAITQGELDAGATISGAGSVEYNGVNTFSAPHGGRNSYRAGSLSFELNDNGWDVAGGIYISPSNPVAFPWQTSYISGYGTAPPPSIARNDIAAPANWSVV